MLPSFTKWHSPNGNIVAMLPSCALFAGLIIVKVYLIEVWYRLDFEYSTCIAALEQPGRMDSLFLAKQAKRQSCTVGTSFVVQCVKPAIMITQ